MHGYNFLRLEYIYLLNYGTNLLLIIDPSQWHAKFIIAMYFITAHWSKRDTVIHQRNDLSKWRNGKVVVSTWRPMASRETQQRA